MQLLYVTRRGTDHWLVEALRQMGHVVEVGDWSGPAGWAAEDGYDLVLADLGQPDPQALQALGAEAPVVALADAADPRQRAALLRAGADACFVRPLHLIEVQTRLMAMARLSDRARASSAGGGAGLSLDRPARRLALGGRQVALSPIEFRLVAYLLRREGEVVELATLGRHLHGEAAEPQPERLRAQIGRLRRKLARALGDPLIHGVPGHGYVLRPDPARAD